MPTDQLHDLQTLSCAIGVIVARLVALPFFDWDDPDPFPQLNLQCVVAAVVAALLYPVPIIIGRIRNHRKLPALMVVNLGLGWTVVGWGCALAWALYREGATP